MKPILLSIDRAEREAYLSHCGSDVVIVHGEHCLGKLPGRQCYDLRDLYRDEVFFDALSKVTASTTLVIVDCMIECCRSEAEYIREYTKLKPLSLQAGDVRIIDSFAFYFSEKSIYRPFLYLHEQVFWESLQEFYGFGVYADYTGNQVERYAERVSGFIDASVPPVNVSVHRFSPTEAETSEYALLKQDVILQQKKPKASVVNDLFKFIDGMETKKEYLRELSNKVVVSSNHPRKRFDTYSVALNAMRTESELVFVSSGFGLDELHIAPTFQAIQRHNLLMEMIRG